jgi:hypothetical protein
MPDPSSSALPDSTTEPDSPDRSTATPKPKGWPLWVRILLAAVVLSFVWSPFLAMLMRLSRVNPSLQPTGGSSNFTPPAQPAPSAGPAAAPPAPAPTP